MRGLVVGLFVLSIGCTEPEMGISVVDGVVTNPVIGVQLDDLEVPFVVRYDFSN